MSMKVEKVLGAYELLCVKSQSSTEICDTHVSHQPAKGEPEEETGDADGSGIGRRAAVLGSWHKGQTARGLQVEWWSEGKKGEKERRKGKEREREGKKGWEKEERRERKKWGKKNGKGEKDMVANRWTVRGRRKRRCLVEEDSEEKEKKWKKNLGFREFYGDTIV
ncbi:hypothetical protein GOBAR_AA19959 [Gossypium barbadense]|uniref:Uncharacterized protein n=1 Tax=Gossypium barbadense TaxID=3634 RepID=A0A2P5XBI9_GOSBA|nr:hypothetical protein GOBAR_AA19959 [Gossypium barbadense]